MYKICMQSDCEVEYSYEGINQKQEGEFGYLGSLYRRKSSLGRLHVDCM